MDKEEGTKEGVHMVFSCNPYTFHGTYILIGASLPPSPAAWVGTTPLNWASVYIAVCVHVEVLHSSLGGTMMPRVMPLLHMLC